ncbi:PseG/SpsG family protein [Candidatus Margulisiibacteriota bacterium]
MKNDKNALQYLQKYNIEKVIIPNNLSVIEESAQISAIIESEDCLLFVLDVLENDQDKDYMQALKATGVKILAITDDSNYRSINAHLIINGNPNQQGIDYSKEVGRYLLGPQYFIMRPEYADIEVNAPGPEVKRILVTMGGSDHNNLLFKILKALQNMTYQGSILIVTSEASGYLDKLKQYVQTLSFNIDIKVDVKSLVPLWTQCDIAITAGGNTLFERIATRLPGATICQLDRQMEIADCFAGQDVNMNLGYGPDMTEGNIAKALSDFIANRELHNKQYAESPGILDGNGLQRVGEEIKILVGR